MSTSQLPLECGAAAVAEAVAALPVLADARCDLLGAGTVAGVIGAAGGKEDCSDAEWMISLRTVALTTVTGSTPKTSGRDMRS